MKHRSATWFALRGLTLANGFTFCCLLLLAAAGNCLASELSLAVVDSAGRGVSDVVVTAASVEAPSTAPVPATAVMDQRQLAFVPRVLVISVGTSVEFPNSDSVSHQVYSFSPSKKFQLPLYKGELHPPVVFEREGLVVLGCNIHDQMVGYIYVTSAAFFGQTDATGTVHLHDLPPGQYRLTIWSPLIADAAATLARSIAIDSPDEKTERFQLTRPLRVRPEPRPRRGDWEY